MPILLLVTVVAPTSLIGQSADPQQMVMPDHAMELIDQTPPDALPPPVKISGIGSAHIPITASAEAQAWFDQGLNLYHDFWDYEAARAFEQAMRVDPACAMCYWGLYKAESFYHSNSQRYAEPALAKAVSLQDRVSERERLYIQATASALREATDRWRTLAERYPDDLQAQIFLAQTSQGSEQQLAILDRVIAADPRNSAANHYYIHALEGSAHAERALKSADILGQLAPSSGHMVHMPGHIYFRLGEYGRAEAAFAQSERVDEAYMREQHVDPDNDWNYVHNLMYAIANFMEEGKLDDATRRR